MLSDYLRFYERDVPVGTEYVIVREQLLTGQTDMDKVLERLNVLIDSSTPIVVMETVEEVRAVRMVRAACSALNLAAFEWTIASGLARAETARSGWPRCHGRELARTDRGRIRAASLLRRRRLKDIATRLHLRRRIEGAGYGCKASTF